MPQPLLVSVVVPTFRRAAALQRTLEALLESDLPSEAYEVIIVDDSEDQEAAVVVEHLQTARTSVRYLRNPGHGAAAARNAGAKIGSGELLLFLDDDMLVGPAHLRQHLQTHKTLPGALVGGDRWYAPSSLSALEASPFGRYRIALERGYAAGRGEGAGEGVKPVSTLPSFDLSITSSAFWSLGGFDESFPYAGAEDQDLSKRATLAGLRLLRNHEIRLLHDDPTTTLRQFALREERGAHTVVALVRKFPEYLGEFYRNEPLSQNDSLGLACLKLAKSALSTAQALSLLHRATGLLELFHAPEPVLWRAYSSILGLHIFRGYREALRPPTSPPE